MIPRIFRSHLFSFPFWFCFSFFFFFSFFFLFCFFFRFPPAPFLRNGSDRSERKKKFPQKKMTSPLELEKWRMKNFHDCPTITSPFSSVKADGSGKDLLRRHLFFVICPFHSLPINMRPQKKTNATGSLQNVTLRLVLGSSRSSNEV